MASDGKEATLLIVDDDELVLSSLEGLFALEGGFRVLGVADPRAAVDELERTPVDVVISDFLMPRMNGIELLVEARRRQPDAARVLLTGYADKENAIRAINDAGLYHYLEKPWDNDTLLHVVRNAVEHKSLRQRLAEKVRSLDRLVDEHRRLATRHDRIARELAMAARVQRSLLPAELPAVDGFALAAHYEPSEPVGGDFYDCYAERGRTLLLVADVIGHGVSAALTTMLLKASFQDAAAREDDPRAILAAMNGALARVIPEGMYAAAAVVRLEPPSGRVRLANAGLPFPFVLRAGAGGVDELAVSGTPLGLFDEPALVEHDDRTVALEPGDVLLVGSDGLGSVAGPDGRQFEDAELRRTLEASVGAEGTAVLRRLVEAARSFGGGRPLPDDVNLVAVTRRG